MKRSLFFSLALLLILGEIFVSSAQAQSPDTSPPINKTVKLIFIHHSTGENWLTDDYGNLGRELYINNYFVSDTNYGWGPDSIGDRTDIVNWREWFRSSETPRYMEALFTENRKNSDYERGFGDPGGENEIVMFKSCFPNSALAGNPDDPPDPNEDFTVGHAKYVYTDLLNYFSTRPDKLFIIITAPPLQDATYADNARAFNNWLVYNWLAENNYALNNVAVFDFYNVLTHPNNHHRVEGGQIEHSSNGINTLYYDSDGDDHPNVAGSQKATQEFIPLLNFYYHRWAEGNPAALLSPKKITNPTMEAQAPPAGESPPENQSPTPLPPSDLIDDFEGSPPTGTDGWIPYWDESTTTQFDCSIEDGNLRIDFDIAAESWATCTLFFDNLQDWSQFQGIEFYYRADAPTHRFDFTLHSGSVDEPTNYQFTIGNRIDWVSNNLTWNQILGVDWEADARNPIDPTQITGVSFGFTNEEGTMNRGTLWVDDLRLVGKGIQPGTAIPEAKFIEESGNQPQTESEASSDGGGGLCPGTIAIGALIFAGMVIFPKKKRSSQH